MTILTETERKVVLLYYGRGWSYQEIAAEILKLRANKIRRDIENEVIYCVAHRFSKQVKSKALEEIKEKRLRRGDVEEYGIIRKRRGGE